MLILRFLRPFQLPFLGYMVGCLGRPRKWLARAPATAHVAGALPYHWLVPAKRVQRTAHPTMVPSLMPPRRS